MKNHLESSWIKVPAYLPLPLITHRKNKVDLGSIDVGSNPIMANSGLLQNNIGLTVSVGGHTLFLSVVNEKH